MNMLGFYINKSCNLRCKYCFIGKNEVTQPEGVLPLDVYKKIVDWFSVGDFYMQPMLAFCGEEPTLHWGSVVSFMEYAREKVPKVNLAMTTNGTLLTEDMVKFLATMNSELLISCDGVEHNNYRVFPGGGPSLDRVVESIKLAVEYKLRLTVLCTMIPGAVSRLSETVEFFHGIGVRQVALNKVVEGYIDYTEQDYIDLTRERWKAAQYADDVGLQLVFMEKTCKDVQQQNRAARERYTCGACYGSIGVDMHGDYYPCHRLIWYPEYKIGDYKIGVDPEKREFWRSLDYEQCHGCTVEGCSGCYVENLGCEGDLLKLPLAHCTMERIRNDVGKMLARRRGLLPSIDI